MAREKAEARDRDYEIRAFTPGIDAILRRWAADAARVRADLDAAGQAALDIPYEGPLGDTDRERFDLFRPRGAPRGLIVFLHGGYWKEFGRADWSHFAKGGLAAGWAVAIPSYSLAPAARIATMVRQAAAATIAAARAVDGPLVLAGHSAGGHLALRLGCRDVALGVAADRLTRIVAISPVADLRPLLDLSMNDVLGLTAEEAADESPVLSRPCEVPVTVWAGAEERPVFLEHAAALARAWPGTTCVVEPGRHHFDVTDGLETPASPMMGALIGPSGPQQ